MKQSLYSQELVRRFNEDEAVWQCFERKRQTRNSISPFIDSILDEIDWQESGEEARQKRCIGRPFDLLVENDTMEPAKQPVRESR